MTKTFLNTRHFAIIGASILGTANVLVNGDISITVAAVGVLTGAFIWDKKTSK